MLEALSPAGGKNRCSGGLNLYALWDTVSLYKQLEPFAEVAGLAIGDPGGQRFSSTEQHTQQSPQLAMSARF